MIDPGFLVEGILRGVLGGRRKRGRRALRYLTRRGRGGSFVNANTLLTAAGVAWGVFETMQSPGSPASPSGAVGSPGSMGSPPPIPTTPAPPAASAIPPDALRMIRLAISAGSADGALGEPERARILEQARAAGAEHLIEAELQQRYLLSQIVGGVDDPAQRATLYVLAFGIIRADESVSGAERIYLAQLANLLGLDPETVTRLEGEAAARIDAEE
jgi:uncharacterized membrane protein YebE (DUF533 family)